MPASVFLLGLLSLAMLLWTDQVSQRQRRHFAFANSLMDLRVLVATAHLWLEEGISGEGEAVIDRASSDLRAAVRLAEILRAGGEAEYGLVVQPLDDPKLQRRTEDLARLLTDFEVNARERRKNPGAAGEGSALENRSDQIFDEVQRTAEELETAVEQLQAADYVAARRLVFAIFVAWTVVVTASATGLLHRERRRQRAEEALQRAYDELESRVAERTNELSTVNEQLQQLSGRLLTAQETESTRISRELHDSFGHSFVLMKLRLGAIERELRADQSVAREDCKTLSQSIDQTIEDLHRLSRDLTPVVLEDLGLTATLRSLVPNCTLKDRMGVVASIVDVDHLVPASEHVGIYRIIQEAFTNAAKHAEARRVCLRVERQGDRLSFVVEDDGKGFDLRGALTRDAAERGLGLATMQERARMLRGSLDISSEEGKGTRVTLTVPVRSGSSLS